MAIGVSAAHLFQERGLFICRVHGCMRPTISGERLCGPHAAAAIRVLQKRPLDELENAAKRKPRARQIYFVQPEGGGPIKIGTTRGAVDSRIAKLQTGSAFKLRLRASFPAERWVEKALHKGLAAFRISGEWFQECDEIVALIAAAKIGRHDLILEFAEKHL